jgi:phosphoribosyl 1,2-cyclic phosphate phosphodiesterase
VTVTPFQSFEAAGLTITPLPANHDPKCEPVIYLIADGSQTILYAHDTGYLIDDTWRYLTENRPHLDLVSLDCTTIREYCRDGHMGLSTANEVAGRLRQIGCVDDRPRLILNHFSHNGGATYDELLAEPKAAGFEVAYDGMSVTVDDSQEVSRFG